MFTVGINGVEFKVEGSYDYKNVNKVSILVEDYVESVLNGLFVSDETPFSDEEVTYSYMMDKSHIDTMSFLKDFMSEFYQSMPRKPRPSGRG